MSHFIHLKEIFKNIFDSKLTGVTVIKLIIKNKFLKKSMFFRNGFIYKGEICLILFISKKSSKIFLISNLQELRFIKLIIKNKFLKKSMFFQNGFIYKGEICLILFISKKSSKIFLIPN